MDERESRGSGVGESLRPLPWLDRRKLEVFKKVIDCLKNRDEAQVPDFENELWDHFNRLPAKYALEVNAKRAEDVLTHRRLLQLAVDAAKRPVFEVRVVQVPPVYDGKQVDSQVEEVGQSSSSYFHDKNIHPLPSFGSSPNLEALSLEVKKGNDQEGDTVQSSNLHFSRPMHEIMFSADDRPKLLSELTSLLAEMGLNIQEAHAFSTNDGYSLDVFVVDGWPYQETEQLKHELTKEILKMELQVQSASEPQAFPPLEEHAQSNADLISNQVQIPIDGTDDWEIDAVLLKYEDKIASGSSVDLYKGTLYNQEVAIKVLKPEGGDVKIQQEFAQEIYILRKVRHRNIVQFLGASTRPPKLCIITEYMSGGNIRSFLQNMDGGFRLPDLLRVAMDVSNGMNYLHQSKIIHRDLKSSNLLMDEYGVVKIADFGLARVKVQSGEMTSETGTYRWMAPEVIEHKLYDHKADVFSFGIVLWELLTGKVPYEELTPLKAALGVIQRGIRPTIPDQTHPKLAELLERCWHREPSLRPEFSEIVDILKIISKKVGGSDERKKDKSPIGCLSVLRLGSLK